ncbi:PepSY domain-containing protein [Geomicrobium sp. JSM 1781026]|uniref:PepSY domain-containing protein n=1 Tax=Geomicrobium sp. JSM 1781026 TaxID=3344580 RepID=UPI0035BF2672
MKKLLIITSCLAVIAGSATLISLFTANANNTIIEEQEVTRTIESMYPGTVQTIELTHENNDPRYEVEIENRHGTYDAVIDATSGDMLHLEQSEAIELESPNDQETEKNEDVLISPERAEEIALAEVENGYVDDLELEREDGRVYYEIELETSQGEVDMEIDAYTGEIVIMSFD